MATADKQPFRSALDDDEEATKSFTVRMARRDKRIVMRAARLSRMSMNAFCSDQLLTIARRIVREEEQKRKDAAAQ